jgi:hypothetical protein
VTFLRIKIIIVIIVIIIARCAYAANVAVGKDLDIFALGAVSLNYIYAPNCK